SGWSILDGRGCRCAAVRPAGFSNVAAKTCRCQQSRQLPRLHRQPGRAEAASPDTPAASAFSTPPLRRLWLPISVTDLINRVHGERLAGIAPAIFGVAP